jgi:hypothetical protein
MNRFPIYALCALLSFGIGTWIGNEIGAGKEIPIQPSSVKEGFELLTWESASHDLCFALVPKTKMDSFASNWFAKWNHECGVARLMEELSTLPPGTYVEWTNRPRFNFPRKVVADRLGEFAKSRGIDWRENPAVDVPAYSDDPE